jgi:type II secretory pathway pseudopilin PulG
MQLADRRGLDGAAVGECWRQNKGLQRQQGVAAARAQQQQQQQQQQRQQQRRREQGAHLVTILKRYWVARQARVSGPQVPMGRWLEGLSAELYLESDDTIWSTTCAPSQCSLVSAWARHGTTGSPSQVCMHAVQEGHTAGPC